MQLPLLLLLCRLIQFSLSLVGLPLVTLSLSLSRWLQFVVLFWGFSRLPHLFIYLLCLCLLSHCAEQHRLKFKPHLHYFCSLSAAPLPPILLPSALYSSFLTLFFINTFAVTTTTATTTSKFVFVAVPVHRFCLLFFVLSALFHLFVSLI